MRWLQILMIATGSMAQFREDLERYLTNRPILARAPGRWRAFGLFVRRHRLGVASAALLSLAILTGTAVSLHFGYREAQARSQAELRSEQLAAVNQFIHDTLTAADPDNTLGEQVTLVETLTEAARLLPLDQGMDPPVRAELHRLIGSILLNLGRSEEGSVQLSHAADLYGQVSDPTLDDVWLTRIEQARAALESGHIDEALDITDSLSPDIGQLAAGAHVRNYWAAIRGRALLESGRLDDAEVLVEHHLSEAEDEIGAQCRGHPGAQESSGHHCRPTRRSRTGTGIERGTAGRANRAVWSGSSADLVSDEQSGLSAFQ